MRFKKCSAKKTRPGFTLLETLLALGISSSVMLAGAYALNQRANDVRDKASAVHLQTLLQASQRLARDHYATWSTAGTSFVMTPNGTDPYSVALQAYLPPNFANNSYRQTWRVSVRPVAGPPAGRFDVLVVTGDDGSNTALPVDPYRVGQIVGLAGPMAGFFMDPTSNTPCGGTESCTKIQGAFGGWSLPDIAGFNLGGISAPVFAGYVMLDKNTVFADYLYRNAVPGHPELNTMQTSIDMNNQELENTSAVTFGPSGVTQSRISRDASGNLIIESGANAPIQMQGSDVYVGSPNGSQNNLNGTGTMRAQAVELRSPRDIVFSTPFLDGDTGARITLDELMPRYRGVENWAADSGQIIPKPICHGAGKTNGGIPQIITTVHAFEGGVTQEAPIRRVLPMRVRADDNGDHWVAKVEYLNPYPNCNAGNLNDWRESVLDQTCAPTNIRPGFVIAQSFCYYPTLDQALAPLPAVPSSP